MECEISDSSSKVKWFKEKTQLKMGDRISDEMDGNIRRLIFDPAEFKDAGEYVCKFENIQSAAKLTVDGKCSSEFYSYFCVRVVRTQRYRVHL